MLKKYLAVVLISTSLTSFACSIDGKEGFVPENHLNISPTAKIKNNMDITTFNEIIDKVEKVYAPIIASMNATLSVERYWNDGTVNAYASQDGDTWEVAMFGGLARHHTITNDAFRLVVCHEVGHHIGGAPKYSGGDWASNEGQADYFAGLKCLRRTFRGEDNIAIVAAMNIPAEVTQTCESQFSSADDQAICKRSSMAGLSGAKLFQDLRGQSTAPDFTTPDLRTVNRTNDNHPDTQCRLDTYYSGAICGIDDAQDVDQNDESVGVCYRNSGDTIGVRPLCWFKPAI